MNKKQQIKQYEKINNNILTITLEDGTIVDANIILTFKENGDQFIIYEIEENEYSVAYGAKVQDDNTIKAVEEDEWPILEKLFNEWIENNNDFDESN